MEFSKRLSAIARWLIKPRLKSAEVYIHPPTLVNGYHWIVVVDGQSEMSGRFKGTGMTQASVNSSFIRAIVELGENILFRTHGFQDRNGVSGGIFRATAVERGKYELLERDAFLYHYRGRVPFLEKLKCEDERINLFRMHSSSPEVHTFLATTTECAAGLNACILLGLGAHRDAEKAKEKAKAELSTMMLDHQLRPGWCANLENAPEEISRLPDFHHVQSRDARNIEILRNLCHVQDLADRKQVDVSMRSGWTIENFESPIRFIKYCRVSHPGLQQLRFGTPETELDKLQVKPLYHPVW